MSELLKRLRAAAQMLPPGATIGLPVEIIREALGAAAVEGATADLSVAQLAERFGRSRSTVRGWLEAGRFPGAYKLRKRSRALRVPNGRWLDRPASTSRRFSGSDRGRRRPASESPGPLPGHSSSGVRVARAGSRRFGRP